MDYGDSRMTREAILLGSHSFGTELLVFGVNWVSFPRGAGRTLVWLEHGLAARKSFEETQAYYYGPVSDAIVLLGTGQCGYRSLWQCHTKA